MKSKRSAPYKKPPLRIQPTTLWDYPSQHYGEGIQGDPKYKGATPSYIVWNLLQRYTKKGDLVDAIARAIKTVTGIDTELSTTGGTSDGRFIADICPQVIECGPTNASIHKIDECIRVDELMQLPRIYFHSLKNLLIK